jgi:site-specific DNA-cytosine methylase
MKVPLDIDILVAGSSCVDLSRLNAHKVQDILDGYESKDTFAGVLAYCEAALPPIVVLENVRHVNAWSHFQESFQKLGYAATHIKVDTKYYYLPQTREREYMLCVHKAKVGGKSPDSTEAVLAHWEELMKQLRRPASSPFTSFLLPADDSRVLSMANRDDSTTAPTSWEACRGIHKYVREHLGLGHGTPVTYPFRECCDAWLPRRSEREHDCLSICHLRWAARGDDANYKE